MYTTELQKKLSAGTIDEFSEEAVKVCESVKMRHEDVVRIRLSVEEALLVWQEKLGTDCTVRLRAERRFLRPCLILTLPAEASCNPFRSGEENPYHESILRNLMIAPDYYYKNGQNCLQYRLKKPELNPLLKLLYIVLFALVFGVLGKLIIPANIITILTDNIISPTYDKFLEVLGCVAGPLIFFSVAWGIYGIGDTSTLSRLGKGMMLRLSGRVLLMAALALAAFPLFHCIMSAGSVSLLQLVDIYQMFLDMLPTTIIEPFATGNTLQIIVLAIEVGVAILFLGRRTRAIAMAVEQINLLISFLMGFISNMVPYFVAVVLVNMIWSGKLEILKNSWRYLLILLAALLCNMGFLLAFTSLRQKVRPGVLLKKTLPSYLIALATASSSAAFGTLTQNSEKKFGISPAFTGFGIPLGIVLEKCATAMNNVLICLYIAEQTGTECSLSWLLMAVLVCAIAAIATPPIPGGGVTAYTLIFTQMGLPAESLGVVLAMDMISDFLITSSDIFCLPLDLTNIAGSFDLLDRETLRRP